MNFAESFNMSQIDTGMTKDNAIRRLPSIQYLRAIAALMVVAFHIIGRSALVGAAGVDIFFVMSGFVMWLVIDCEDVKPLRFAYDRGARLLPLYWLCTLVLAIAAILLPHLFSRLHLTPEWIASSLVLLPSYQPGTGDIFPVLNQGWTLSYEMFFYAILFVATFAPRSWRSLVVSGFLFASISVGLWHAPRTAMVQVYTNPLLAEFLLGFLFVRFFSEKAFSTSWAAGLLIVVGLAGFVIAAFHGEQPDGWRRVIVWGCPAFALVAGCVNLERIPSHRSFRTGQLLGDASYSIYLTQGLFISLLTHLWKLFGSDKSDVMHVMAFAAIGLLVCTIGGTLVHLLVERPILKTLRRSYKTQSWFHRVKQMAMASNYQFRARLSFFRAA